MNRRAASASPALRQSPPPSATPFSRRRASRSGGFPFARKIWRSVPASGYCRIARASVTDFSRRDSAGDLDLSFSCARQLLATARGRSRTENFGKLAARKKKINPDRQRNRGEKSQ